MVSQHWEQCMRRNACRGINDSWPNMARWKRENLLRLVLPVKIICIVTGFCLQRVIGVLLTKGHSYRHWFLLGELHKKSSVCCPLYLCMKSKSNLVLILSVNLLKCSHAARYVPYSLTTLLFASMSTFATRGDCCWDSTHKKITTKYDNKARWKGREHGHKMFWFIVSFL